MKKSHLKIAVILVALLVIPLTGCGLLERTGAVTGTVTDKETGDPLQGVRVSIGTRTDETNEDGEYTLTEVPAGTQTISAQALEPIDETFYATYADEINVIGQDSIVHNIEMITMDEETEIARDMLENIQNYFHSLSDQGEPIFNQEYGEALGNEITDIFSQYVVFALVHLVETQVLPIAVLKAIDGEESGIIDIGYNWENMSFNEEDIGELQPHEEDFWIINVDDFIVFEVEIDIAEDPDPDDLFITNIEIISATMEEDIPQELDFLPDGFDPKETLYAGAIELRSTLTWEEIGEIIDGDAPPAELSDLFEFEIIWMEGTDDLLDGTLEFSGMLQINIIEFSYIEFEGNNNPEEVTVEIDVYIDGSFNGPGLEINGETSLYLFAYFHFTEESDGPESFDIELSITSATDIQLGTELMAFNGAIHEFYLSGGMETIENEEQPLINELQFVAYGGLYHNLIENEISSPEEWDVAFEGEINIDMQPAKDGALNFGIYGYIQLPEVKPFEGELVATLSLEEATNRLFDWEPVKVEMQMEAQLGDTDSLHGTITIDFNDRDLFNVYIENKAGYYLLLAFEGPDSPELVDDVDSGIFSPQDDKLAEISIIDGVFKIKWFDDDEEVSLF